MGAWSQHLFACAAYDSLIIHEELAQLMLKWCSFYPKSEEVAQVLGFMHSLYRKHIFYRRQSSIHEKSSMSFFFFTLFRLSIGHRNSWHQKAPAWHSWRLTILTVGQQKTLISSFQNFLKLRSCFTFIYENGQKSLIFWEDVECLFSTGSDILAGRENLKPENFQKLLFLCENLKLQNFALDW